MKIVIDEFCHSIKANYFLKLNKDKFIYFIKVIYIVLIK